MRKWDEEVSTYIHMFATPMDQSWSHLLTLSALLYIDVYVRNTVIYQCEALPYLILNADVFYVVVKLVLLLINTKKHVWGYMSVKKMK